MPWLFKLFIFIVDFIIRICESASNELNQNFVGNRFMRQFPLSETHFSPYKDALHNNAHIWSKSAENQNFFDIQNSEINSPHPWKPSIKLLKNTQDAFGLASRLILPEDSFGCAVQSKFFVDKTLFIKHFMTRTEHSVVLAPKQFGKSTILSMLRDFCEMHLDGNGVIQDNRTSVTFEIFQNLKIYREEPLFFNEHFANYTVLTMNLNDLAMISLRTFLPSFRRLVNRLFSAHPYLMRSEKLTHSEKRKFENYSYPRSYMDYDDLSSGGRVLTRLLYKHFHKKCIVLIDGVDAPALNILLNEDSTDAAEAFNILAKFISKMVRNNHQVHRSLMTGVLSIGNIYTREASNLAYFPVFEDAAISEYFGFNDKDIRELLAKFKKQDEAEGVRSMFGGYNAKGNEKDLYNTNSIRKFLETGSYGPHSTSDRGITLLKPVLQYDLFGKTLEKSLAAEIPVTLRLHFKRENLYNFRPILFGKILKAEYVQSHENMVFQYLLENGYYTIKYRTSDNAVRLIVPNIEMKNELRHLIYTKKFFLDKYRIKEEVLANYLISLDKLNQNETSYTNLCSSVLNIFEHKMPEKSSEFQGPLLTYPALCSEVFKEVYSQTHPLEYQRADIFIRKKDGGIIIIELRVNRSPAYYALKQIVSNKYYADKITYPREKIFVGLYIDRNRKCEISYLWNSDNLADVRNVTVEAKKAKSS